MIKIVFLFILFFHMPAYGQVKTQKVQYVHADLFGLYYNYETPLSQKFTMISHGGLIGGFGYSAADEWMYGDGWHYALRASFGSDFRYYYNLKKRTEKKKFVRHNSGNFWSLDLRFITPPMYSHNMESASIFVLSPYWGLRRVYSNCWLFEFNTGLNMGVNGYGAVLYPKMNVKFGYLF